MRRKRRGCRGCDLPESVSVTREIADLAAAEAVLLALPMQALGGFLAAARGDLTGAPLVACCKGVDLATAAGPDRR